MNGGRGHDFVNGGRNNDVVKGGPGDDVLCGGRGARRDPRRRRRRHHLRRGGERPDHSRRPATTRCSGSAGNDRILGWGKQGGEIVDDGIDILNGG